jgi:serine/threonine protein kinase
VHAQRASVLDLKPANLLFDEDGALHISDFGISKVADLTMGGTATGAGGGKGTPVYMAPEQVSDGTACTAVTVVGAAGDVTGRGAGAARRGGVRRARRGGRHLGPRLRCAPVLGFGP